MNPYTYVHDERRPVEVLVYRVDPSHVEEFLRVDHEVWTLGEALLPGLDRIPMLSKEVWLDDSRPGEVTLVFVWDDKQSWDRVARSDVQAALTARFEQLFPHRAELVSARHEESQFGIHRVSRFERKEK